MWRHFPLLKLWLHLTFNRSPMHEQINLILWKLDWNNGISRVDAAATTVLVAATTVTTTVADVDNVELTTLLDEAIHPDVVVAATPPTVVEVPLVRNKEVTPRKTQIFVGAEPTNFAVPLPFFGRSC